jgi:hypothetical protein
MKIQGLLALLPVLALAACASTSHWTAAGGNRGVGIVKLSYQYPESQPLSLSEAQAGQLAANRCNVWGYSQADAIPGQVRECSDTDGGSCKLWTVTREYQCSGDGTMAHRTDENAGEGSVSAHLTPLRIAR